MPEALNVAGLDLADLHRTGDRPEHAMGKFRDWVRQVGRGGEVVFVGFNAGFDWSFVNWYFHRFLGENPFGFAPLDIKSYYMGLTGCSWNDTRSSRVLPEYRVVREREHNALTDARTQAAMFEKMRIQRPSTRGQ